MYQASRAAVCSRWDVPPRDLLCDDPEGAPVSDLSVLTEPTARTAPQRRVQVQASLTAEITCAQRAVEHLMPADERLIDDPFATCFVQRRTYRARFATPAIARLTRRIFDRRYPGFMAIVLLRNRFYEDALADALRDGIDQVVLLGAGYDTSAFRLELGAATLFEVDAPMTQAHKQLAAARHALEPKCPLVYVPCDFEREDIVTTLTERGFDTGRRSVFVWLGVSYFLSPEAVRRTLADVATLSAPGSRLVWDHMDQAVIDGTTPYIGARRAAAIVQKRGEPYRFGVTSEEAAALVDSYGFDAIDQARLPELGRRYDAWCRTDDFVALMTAQRRTAP
jgi:methyltransferase (TIGR00027 family)